MVKFVKGLGAAIIGALIGVLFVIICLGVPMMMLALPYVIAHDQGCWGGSWCGPLFAWLLYVFGGIGAVVGFFGWFHGWFHQT